MEDAPIPDNEDDMVEKYITTALSIIDKEESYSIMKMEVVE